MHKMRSRWLRFRLSTMLIACVLLAVMMTVLAPGAMPVGHRLGFIILLLFPAWLGWKSAVHHVPFLMSIGNGLSIGVLTFLALCFLELIEAKLTTGAAHLTIGMEGSLVGYAVAYVMISRSEKLAGTQLDHSRFRFSCSMLILLSVPLLLIFVGGRSYVAWIRNSQIELSEAVKKWDASLFFEKVDLPWYFERFLTEKILVPRGICFYNQVPMNTTSLRTIPDTVTVLGLRGKNIDDESLARIPKSLKLEHLFLFSTRVTDNGMRLIRQWPGIAEYYLFDTPITSVSVKQLAQRDLTKAIVAIGTQITSDEKGTISRLMSKNAVFQVDPIRPGHEYPGSSPRYRRAIIYGNNPQRENQLKIIDLNEWRQWMDILGW